GGELGVSARTTLPGPSHGTGGKMGDSTGITLPGIHFGIGGKMGVSGRNTSPKRGITTHEELKQCS
ncbi:TPA: hypothetical protein ACIXXC_006764, partial [Pseudomonas aeruginosa]